MATLMNNRMVGGGQGSYTHMNFHKMLTDAKAGDAEAQAYLREYIVKKSALANKRLRQLETHGLTDYAYQRTYVFLKNEYNTVKFPQGVKGRSVESLAIQALELQHFISDETSTVRGAKAAALKNYEGLQELAQLGYNVSFDPVRLRQVNNIMGSDGIRALSGRFRYEIMDYINNALDSGMDIEEIQMNIDRYQTGEITYTELIQ